MFTMRQYSYSPALKDPDQTCIDNELTQSDRDSTTFFILKGLQLMVIGASRTDNKTMNLAGFSGFGKNLIPPLGYRSRYPASTRSFSTRRWSI